MSRHVQGRGWGRALALAALLALLLCGACASTSAAVEDDGATWRLEQPLPPVLPNGRTSSTPIGLGKIGDIEFWAPNRGLLITAGNPPTIPPGVWAYNGVTWHELASVCGATDGHIAWAGPDEFWTVSDGRPGQASIEGTPPLEDNTLCHFAGGEVVGSYASLAFRPSSYQAMHGAACFGPEDCWFGGENLPEGQVGAFHLHWDGQNLNAEPGPQGHAVEDMRCFGGLLYESVRVKSDDLLNEPEPPTEPSDIHEIEPAGIQPPFVSLFPGLPEYSSEEFPEALDFPHLSSDEDALWGAADPVVPTPPGSAPAEVTLLRYAGGQWTEPIGPLRGGERPNPFTKEPHEEFGPHAKNEAVNSIAAEPPDEAERETGGESAWLALTSGENAHEEPNASALLARVSSDGAVAERQSLPSSQEQLEGVGPKGGAGQIACAAPHDCWMATSQGWLFHLAPEGERTLPEDTDPNFSKLITFRPADAGIPPIVPDAPPADDSGLPGEVPPVLGTLPETATPERETKVTVPLISNVHTHLVHGTTLQLSFHLAVRARVQLIAKRRKTVVAKTAMTTFAAGNRKLQVLLSRTRWPTKLDLQSHALAPLPTVSTKSTNATTNSVTTRFAQLPKFAFSSRLGPFN
jgi:hypothetical protein